MKQFFWMTCMRAFTGFCQVFVCIYMPVWADTYGSNERIKSIWMTSLLLAAPLGIVVGYVITYYMVLYQSWEWSFYLQAFALAPCVVAIIFTPNRYINVEQTI